MKIFLTGLFVLFAFLPFYGLEVKRDHDLIPIPVVGYAEEVTRFHAPEARQGGSSSSRVKREGP